MATRVIEAGGQECIPRNVGKPWHRVRLLSTGEWKRADDALAQFLRCPRDHTAPLFAIEVECEPESGGSAAPPLSD
ncbi:MAG: hypothetical protein ACKO5R_05805 [Planctomycetaceae bacterium]